MGNKVSCCLTGGSPSARYKTYDNNHEYGHFNPCSIPREETSTNLQHISEREPDEAEPDPSTHPTAKPTFMERSKSEMRLRDNRRSFYVLDAFGCSPARPMRKSNSCSTIFLDDSTISQPNMKNTIKCISLAIFYHVANRRHRGHERLMEIFEERLHPITMRKSNSCSTIFLDDSTISQPNMKNTIKCISLAIFYHVANRRHRGHEASWRSSRNACTP